MSSAVLMAIIAGGILVIFFFRGRNAVWGGATLGFIVGLIVALVKHDWNLLALSFAIGTFAGLGAELLGIFSDWLKRKRKY
jgi:hypothetical protein